MSGETPPVERHLGLVGATGVGVGAIVGGGILALTGAAFAATGPSAIVAFALNGVIAFLTAASFAEVASRFPQSGGAYTFAKKVLTLEAAFTVGWVVWFASVLAAVLYAIGFGQFGAVVLAEVWTAWRGTPPDWVTGRWTPVGLGALATLLYTLQLLRRSAGSGPWINAGKLAVFAVLIAGGLWAVTDRSADQIRASMQPFFAEGGRGLLQAMGFTFIALQGFDLIAAVGGEVRDPQRNLPRSMFLSLGIALAVYLPLLFLVTAAGMPEGTSVTAASRADPATILAVAARNFLGSFGFWMVLVAAILSMLSALQANLYAASRVALSMARDRTLPRSLATLHRARTTPVLAVAVTAILVTVILALVPDLSTAGAASSLIFLVTFALSHWVAILVRQRTVHSPPPFRTPWFPLVPLLGGLACVGLAVYQGVAVPSAGLIIASWLGLGVALFLVLFARRARIAEARSAARDPELLRLRGESPLVLVPIANPANARSLVALAHAIMPREAGRVLLLSVVVLRDRKDGDSTDAVLDATQRILHETLSVSMEAGLFPEALTTLARDPWQEIRRVARAHRCASVLLGLSQLSEESITAPVEQVLNGVDCDVVVLRAPQAWRQSQATRILVSSGGRGRHDRLVARLLASFTREGRRDVRFLRVLKEGAQKNEHEQARRALRSAALELCPGPAEVEVVAAPSPADVLVDRAAEADLLILGTRRIGRRQRRLGDLVAEVTRRTTCPILLVAAARR